MPTTKKLELYSYDANPDGSVKISSLLKAFQQIAREDLSSYGITYNMMRESDQVFVIIKAVIVFYKNISIYDEMFLTTIPTKINGITFFRDFFIKDKDNNLLVVCSTSWVLMNYVTRRILRPAEIIREVPSFPDESSDITFSRRFSFKDFPFSKRTNVRKVYYNNLDENNHFNNAETAAFAIDEVSDRLIGGESVKRFEIHFNHESKLNDELTIVTEHREFSSYISAYNNTFNSSAFECKIDF